MVLCICNRPAPIQQRPTCHYIAAADPTSYRQITTAAATPTTTITTAPTPPTPTPPTTTTATTQLALTKPKQNRIEAPNHHELIWQRADFSLCESAATTGAIADACSISRWHQDLMLLPPHFYPTPTPPKPITPYPRYYHRHFPIRYDTDVQHASTMVSNRTWCCNST